MDFSFLLVRWCIDCVVRNLCKFTQQRSSRYFSKMLWILNVSFIIKCVSSSVLFATMTRKLIHSLRRKSESIWDVNLVNLSVVMIYRVLHGDKYSPAQRWSPLFLHKSDIIGVFLSSLMTFLNIWSKSFILLNLDIFKRKIIYFPFCQFSAMCWDFRLRRTDFTHHYRMSHCGLLLFAQDF